MMDVDVHASEKGAKNKSLAKCFCMHAEECVFFDTWKLMQNILKSCVADIEIAKK